MVKRTKHKIPRKGYVMEENSTVYGLKISTEILERADRLAEDLSKDVRRFPQDRRAELTWCVLPLFSVWMLLRAFGNKAFRG